MAAFHAPVVPVFVQSSAGVRVGLVVARNGWTVSQSMSHEPALDVSSLVCPFLSGSVVQSSWPTVCASTNT